jgi:folate-dependent phosphoribosylglycinamide formyltransferase PurN
MKILVLTSKDHLYANLLLRLLFEKKAFSGDTVMIWEQDAIVPGKSKFGGLMRYIRRSGFTYVFLQACKQYLFICLRTVATMQNNRTSIYFPYWRVDSCNAHRELYGGLKTDAAFARVRQFKPDLILSLYSKEFVPERMLKLASYGSVNLHPAYLPQFRGVSPIFWAMAEGATHIGATLHTMAVEIDTGSILSQKKLPMKPPDTEHNVYLRATLSGAELVREYLKKLHAKPGKIRGTPMPKRDQYYSLPTRDAMRSLYANGYALVSFTEILFPSHHI